MQFPPRMSNAQTRSLTSCGFELSHAQIARYITGTAPGRAGLHCAPSAMFAASVRTRCAASARPRPKLTCRSMRRGNSSNGVSVDEHINKPTHVRPQTLQQFPSVIRSAVDFDGRPDAATGSCRCAGNQGQNDFPRAHPPERTTYPPVKVSGAPLWSASPRPTSAFDMWKPSISTGLRPQCPPQAGRPPARLSCSSQSQAVASQPQHAHGVAAASALSHGLDDARCDRQASCPPAPRSRQ